MRKCIPKVLRDKLLRKASGRVSLILHDPPARLNDLSEPDAASHRRIQSHIMDDP